MRRLVTSILLCSMVFTCITCTAAATDPPDPCQTVALLPDMNKRGDNTPTSEVGHIVDDHFTIPNGGKWYRVAGAQMHNKSGIHPRMCGTMYPIYLQGSIPEPDDGTVTRTTCTVTPIPVCSNPTTIKIRRCPDFTAYFLQPPKRTGSAYCFGPAIYSLPKPTVQVKLINGSSQFGDVQKLQFVCSFVPLPDDVDYQAFWFIDGKAVNGTKLATKTELHNLVLSENPGEFENLGVNVACSIRAENKTNGVQGPMSQKSDQFYAGINVLTPTVTVHRGHVHTRHTYIRLMPTVPIGCPPVFGNRCFVTVEVTIPHSNKKCKGSLGSVQPNGNHNCGVRIMHDEWHREHSIEVFWADDQSYQIHANDHRVSLTTTANYYHEIWGNVHLSDVNVRVEDDTHLWKGKECHAICDPHMKTFDGRSYENQNDGTFILYENDDASKKSQVQMKVTPCNPPRHVFCVCAIAVRAGSDVFVIDRCPGKFEPIFKFRSHRDGILDVRKISGNQYKIYLPSGTYLSATLWHYTGKDVMDVHMYPSVGDSHHTRGLCGTLNDNINDDFLTPGGRLEADHNVFSRSWSVSEQDNLITMSPDNLEKLNSWNNTVQFCTCNAKLGVDGPVPNITCSQSTMATCVKKDESVVKTRHSRENSERSLRKKAVITFPGHIIGNGGQTPGNWNTTSARSYCEKYLKDSSSFQTCSKDVTVTKPQDSIDTCVLDIMATRMTMWASSARESLKSICLKELKQNTTYHEEDSDDQPSIAQKIKEITCPNECSRRGRCDNGTCMCEPNFGADDCSIDIRVPPHIYDVNPGTNGTCDIGNCDSAIVEGDIFVDVGNLSCHYQLIEISLNGTEAFYKNLTAHGQYNTLMEIFCPLPELWHPRRRTKRSADQSDDLPIPFVYRWSVGVSNDGEHFGEVTDLIAYNAQCQVIVDLHGLVFELKDEYCFIRGTCALDRETDQKDPCSICKLDQSKFEWSKNDDYCLIDGDCVANNTLAPGNNCSICNVDVSTEHWIPNPDFCHIDGHCVPHNHSSDDNTCLICAVERSQNSWTNICKGTTMEPKTTNERIEERPRTTIKHGHVSHTTRGDVSRTTHDDVPRTTHGDASYTTLGVTERTTRGDGSQTTDGYIKRTTHGDASGTTHDDASHTTHDVTERTTHGDVSLTTHGDMKRTTHLDASGTAHDNASPTTHGVTERTIRVDGSQTTDVYIKRTTHGDASATTHDDASPTTHAVTERTIRVDGSQTTHGNIKRTTHGYASGTTDDDVSYTTHDVTERTTRGAASETTDGNIQRTTHGDASGTIHDDASYTTHDVTGRITRGDGSHTTRGHAERTTHTSHKADGVTVLTTLGEVHITGSDVQHTTHKLSDEDKETGNQDKDLSPVWITASVLGVLVIVIVIGAVIFYRRRKSTKSVQLSPAAPTRGQEYKNSVFTDEQCL